MSRYVGLVVGVLGVLAAVFFAGYFKGAEQYIKDKEVLVAAINEMEDKSKEAQVEWKRGNDELVKKHKRDVTKLQSTIKRLLHTQASKPATASGSSVPDGATPERGRGEWVAEERRMRELQFMSNCIMDTALLLDWQQWARDKHLPLDK